MILTYDAPLYNHFDCLKRIYYDSLNHDYYFIYNGDDESKNNLLNRTLNYKPPYHWSYNPGGIPIMLDKFINIIEQQIVEEYDFVVRENSSTFTNIDVIKKLLSINPDCHYAGFFYPTWNFVSGACTIFSQKILRLLLRYKDYINRNIEDDVAIGQVLSSLGIQKTYIDRYYLGDRTTIPLDAEIQHALTFPQIRVRNDYNRDVIDRVIWNKILKQYHTLINR